MKLPEASTLEITDQKEDEPSELSKKKNNKSYKIPEEIEIKSNEHEIIHNDEDSEDGETNLSINIESFKNSFIMKIFGMLLVLLIIALSTIFILKIPSIRSDIIYDYYDLFEDILFYSSIIFVISVSIFAFYRNLMKIVPINYILFLGFSSYPIIVSSVIATLYYFAPVIVNLLLLMVTCLVIGIYALIKKDRISPLKLFLLVLFSQIIITWFILLFLPIKEKQVYYAFLLAFMIGNNLIYDALLINEKFGYTNSFNDYIYAYLEIFTDFPRFALTKSYIEIKKILIEAFPNLKDKI